MDSQPRLFVSGTMTFVLAFVVKLLASKFVNVFENLPCVLRFLLTCAVTLDELEEEHCPKQGSLSSAQGTPVMGSGPIHSEVVHQPWTWGRLSLTTLVRSSTC